MTFKVTVVNKFSENVLHKGRNGAGVKAELFFIRFDKMFGKHHVSDTKRGRDRFGKGMKKEYRCTLRTKKCTDTLSHQCLRGYDGGLFQGQYRPLS